LGVLNVMTASSQTRLYGAGPFVASAALAVVSGHCLCSNNQMSPTAATSQSREPAGFTTIAELVVDIAREVHVQATTTDSVELLTQTQAQVMRFVHDNPGCSASDIATASGLQRANVSPALSVLKSRGLITSNRDDEDGRAIRIHSTPLADENIAALRRSWADLIAAAWTLGDPGPAGREGDQPPDGVAAALERIRTGLRAGRAETERTV
jgi:DNA-binding MarR family transcriptional regulator